MAKLSVHGDEIMRFSHPVSEDCSFVYAIFEDDWILTKTVQYEHFTNPNRKINTGTGWKLYEQLPDGMSPHKWVERMKAKLEQAYPTKKKSR